MEIDIIEAGCYYHIFNRGINRERLFSEEEHYYKFLELCSIHLIHQIDVLSYCLLPNHFHFLLHILDPLSAVLKLDTQSEKNITKNLSLPLSHLFNAYAQWFNRKNGRTGGLFQRLFRRKRITSEEYLKQVIYYIHRNPMHHDLVQHPTGWLFSSYQIMISSLPTFLKRDQVLEWFGGRENFIDYHEINFEIDGEVLEK